MEDTGYRRWVRGGRASGVLSGGPMGPFAASWTSRPPLTRQDGLDPNRPVAAQREAEALVALVDADRPGEREAGAGVGSVPWPGMPTTTFTLTSPTRSPPRSAQVSILSRSTPQESASRAPARIPARAPRAGAAGQQRGGLARGRLVGAARGGAGARGHQEALGPLLAAAPAQPLRALRPPRAAQLAQQTLRHHLVEARPVLLGDEDPAGKPAGSGRAPECAPIASNPGPQAPPPGWRRAQPPAPL